MTVKKSRKKGFTLTELLVVIVIIGILTAIAIPVTSNIMKNANTKAFESNHSLIVSAINMYISSHNGAFPTQDSDLNNYLLDEKGAAATSLAAYQNSPEGATYVMSYTENSFTLTSTYADCDESPYVFTRVKP